MRAFYESFEAAWDKGGNSTKIVDFLTNKNSNATENGIPQDLISVA